LRTSANLRSRITKILPVFFSRRYGHSSWPEVLILAAWAAIVLFQATRHVMWRDEVRALSIALTGDSFFAMLTTLHGEGHPAIWYMLLRAAYSVFGSVVVLPGLAFAIAIATVGMLIFRSPFPRILIIILLASRCFVYEYSVMARNYGVGALLMFVIAAAYRSRRDRGILLGALLFLLANTNLIAAIMVAPFLLFWLLDILAETGVRWTPKLANFVLNALIATAGVVICALTILPTFNDAAARDWSQASPAIAALNAVVNPGYTTPGTLFSPGLPSVVGSLLLFGMTLGLLPKRSAFVAALVSLILFSLFSAIAAQGDARHAMVWLCFCVMLYWISWNDITEALAKLSPTRPGKSVFQAGCIALLLVLALQAEAGFLGVARAMIGGGVESRSADLGSLIRQRPELANAVVIAEPDYMAEALPYYASNRTYLLREGRFGNFIRFTKSGKLDTNLGEILQVSRELQKTTSSPIIIVLQYNIEKIIPDRLYKEGYNWTFTASKGDIKNFLDGTIRMAQFDEAQSDESYDVYLLRHDDQHGL
jgi:hypothetical protein